jgi:hypothetical protein
MPDRREQFSWAREKSLLANSRHAVRLRPSRTSHALAARFFHHAFRELAERNDEFGGRMFVSIQRSVE